MAAAVPAVTPAAPVAETLPRMLVTGMLGVFLATLASAAINWIPGSLLSIWLGTAVIVYWLLRTPRRDWAPVIAASWLACVAASLLIGRGMPRGIIFPTINLIQALLVAAPLRMFRLDREFTRPRTLLVFYLLVIGPATMVTALAGALVLNRLTGAAFLEAWTKWYMTSALGLAMLVPPLMVLHRESMTAIFARERLPGTLLLLGMVATVIALNVLVHDYPLGFLFFPAVVVITFQRGFAGGALGLCLVVLYLASGLRDVHGALSPEDVRLHLVFVQLYIAAISFTVVIVGAGLEQRRKLEMRLAEAREDAIIACGAAQAANRSKTMFLANMSHELRTPLNAVIGFSNLMHNEMYGPLGDRRYREYAQSIHDAGQHLLEVIGDILDMSKIEAGKYEIVREDVQLNELVDDCVDLMRERAAERSLKIAVELSGPEHFIADRRAMKQILLNLLSNAIKFTPAGGKVTVATKMENDRLVLSVADTGIGIPAAELHRLGEPFVQLRRTTANVSNQSGTGLGLALTRALAECHGGPLIIESEEGLGTCAKIELPLVPEERSKTAA